MNLSADSGNLGGFITTNVRIVWYALITDNFNVSVPWIQIKCIRVRDSKYGVAIVLETSTHAGAYVLGFKVNDVENMF